MSELSTCGFPLPRAPSPCYYDDGYPHSCSKIKSNPHIEAATSHSVTITSEALRA